MMTADDSPHVVFFSRGKGRGHAIPDSVIAEDLHALSPDAAITFVSYSVGGATLKGLGWTVIDLDLPEDNGPWETMVRFLPLLQRFNPALVVSHEEFTAVPAAKAMGLPVVFLTDWFLSAESLQMQALKYADEILFLDEAGYQDVPGYLSQKVVYAGPVLKRFPNTLPTKTECRECVGIPERASLVVVVPGGALFHSEVLAPIVDVVLEAFDALPAADKRLVWVAGEGDHGRLAAKAGGRRNIQLMRPHDSILTTMGAADVVVTKGNRITVLEAEALGIASISISFGHNPLDDNRVARVATNTALRASGLTGLVLAHHMRKAIDKTCALNAASPDTLAMTAALVAERLHGYLIRRRQTTSVDDRQAAGFRAAGDRLIHERR